jgi:predicted nuclease with TOPRIM domain
MSVKTSVKLKELQSRREKLKNIIHGLKQEQSEISRELTQKENKLKNIMEEISHLSPKKTIVSEHAMLRYIERVIGTDLKEIKDSIVDPELEKLMGCLGNGKYPIQDGKFQIIVKDGTVTTVLENNRKYK